MTVYTATSTEFGALAVATESNAVDFAVTLDAVQSGATYTLNLEIRDAEPGENDYVFLVVNGTKYQIDKIIGADESTQWESFILPPSVTANLKVGINTFQIYTTNNKPGDGLTVYRGNLTVSGTVNSAPVAVDITDKALAEDQPFSFQVPAFTDPNGNALTYSATLADGAALPSWLTFDATSRTFLGTPPQNFDGDIAVKVTASDGTLTAFDTFKLDITPVDDAPLAVADEAELAEDGSVAV
ncbi:putative Ig domain-containing protein, partial [Rubellimicrobium roseum]